MYGKIFGQLYTSTLATKGPWEAMALWPHLIGLADEDGNVDMPIDMVAKLTLLPRYIVENGLKALTEPDPDSRSQLAGGRRIVLIDPNRNWGWRLVNYQEYSKMRSNDERREYNRDRMRRLRDIQDTEQQEATEATKTTKATVAPVRNVAPHTHTQNSDLKDIVRFPTHGTRFDEFWETWPNNSRKVAKKACAANWKLHKLDDIADTILAHVKAMSATEQWKEFAPAPKTYLNQRRWEDGAPTEPTERPYF